MLRWTPLDNQEKTTKKKTACLSALRLPSGEWGCTFETLYPLSPIAYLQLTGGKKEMVPEHPPAGVKLICVEMCGLGLRLRL
jgi:hypothetical protein